MKRYATICALDGCGRPFRAMGLCTMHYQRMKNHGSTDEPKRGYAGAICSVKECQSVATDSGMCGKHAQRVRRYGNPDFITSAEVANMRNRLAQMEVRPSVKNSYAKFFGRHEHRVVAEQMLGRPLKEGEIVHHIDGNRRNNTPENLKVMTQSEHIKEHLPEMRAAARAKRAAS